MLLIALIPEIIAKEAASKLGVSDRTVETYFSELKENTMDRIGPDKGGYWKIL